MPAKIKKTLKLAPRKWRRQFQDAIQQSLAKTVTEPVTNAYDSYKRLIGSDNASTGLVSALLKLRVGGHVLHEEIVAGLPVQTRKDIVVRLSRTKASSIGKRECQILDFAQGMSYEELDSKFERYGSEQSGQAAGHAVRGLFGQGILDVMYSHPPGRIRSIKDGGAAECKFFWNTKDEPEVEVEPLDKVSKHRKDWGITGTRNGTLVSFLLDERCKVPHSSETVLARLSNFYMLRLIAADPSCTVSIEQIRRDGVDVNTLRYDLPRGQVLDNFATEIAYEGFPPIVAEGIVVRAETSLPGKEAGDDRANGLLIVDETDAVLDQTLFKYDSSPLLDNVYGVVRLTGIREILRTKLNEGEALLTESRDGFDPKKGLYQALENAITPIIEPTLRKEIERRSTRAANLSEASERKIKRAFDKLNALFEDVTKQSNLGGGGGVEGIEVPPTISFEAENIQLTAGISRRVRLLANSRRFVPQGPIIVDSDNDEIKVEPTSTGWEHFAGRNDVLVAYVSLTSSSIGATSTVTAIAEDSDGASVDATLHVTDVRLPEAVEPPAEGLEFVPAKPTSAPNRRGSLSLLVNPALVPVGSEILVRRTNGDSAVKLVDSTGDDRDEIRIAFRKSDLLPGGQVGRMTLGFRGYGFGQRAKIRAETFVNKANFSCDAQVLIREAPTLKGGVYKDIKYDDLGGSFSRSGGEFDPITGTITINRLHPVNRAAFGADQASYAAAVESSTQAQARLADVMIDTCLYHTAAVAYQNNQLLLPYNDIIGGLRRWIEQFKYEVGDAIYREIVQDYSVPRIAIHVDAIEIQPRKRQPTAKRS